MMLKTLNSNFLDSEDTLKSVHLTPSDYAYVCVGEWGGGGGGAQSEVAISDLFTKMDRVLWEKSL